MININLGHRRKIYNTERYCLEVLLHVYIYIVVHAYAYIYSVQNLVSLSTPTLLSELDASKIKPDKCFRPYTVQYKGP